MAHINFSSANCKNCYKCLRSCPVKAIKFSNQQAEIVEERCIKCGHCLYNCPQNASYIQSDLYIVKEAIKHNKKVIASIDPSFPGYFVNVDEGKVIAAIKKLGFSILEETHIGTELVANIYKEYITNCENKCLITSSCPSANYLIEKYYPSLLKYLIPLDSPMVAHGKILKDIFGEDSFVVFIGPCVSKKFEADEFKNKNILDAVLTFDELHRWINKSEIDINSLEGLTFDRPGLHMGRGAHGDIKKIIDERNMDMVTVNGINHCMEIYEEIQNGKLQDVFVDVSACRGGCVGGPNTVRDTKDFFTRQKKVKEYFESKIESGKAEVGRHTCNIDFKRKFSDKSVFKKEVHEKEIQKIMKLMGKFNDRDELNCGVCGYNTCREKAQAVCEGMAEIDMCLNFMRGKAESITNVIFTNSPSSIMLIDEDINIIEINPAAEDTFVTKAEYIKGKPVSTLIDCSDIVKVKETKINILGKRVVYSQYNGIFIQNILYLEKQNSILVTMNNIMEEEKNKIELMNVRENTLTAAQEIIEKQMRVAHEIASLLGETTAETKVTLIKLKKLIQGN